MSLFRQSARLPPPSEALPGRSTPVQVAGRHAVLYAPLAGPFPAQMHSALFGLGC